MKIPLQDKIAELERRIVQLEQQCRVDAVSTKTVQRITLKPELDNVWQAFDNLFKKAFK